MKKTDPQADQINPLLSRIEALEKRLDSQAKQHAAELEAQKTMFEAKLNDFSGALNSLRRMEGLRSHLSVGTIGLFATVSVPCGWLLCDGSAYEQETYPELFAAIGDRYSTSAQPGFFSVPDMRDRIPFCGELGHTSGSWDMHLQACHIPHHLHHVDVSKSSINLEHTHRADVQWGGRHFHYLKRHVDAKNKGQHLAFKHALRREEAWERDADLRIPHDPHEGTNFPDGEHTHTVLVHSALGIASHKHEASVSSTNSAQQVHGQGFSLRNPVFGLSFCILAKSFVD